MSDPARPRPRHNIYRAFVCAFAGIVELLTEGRNARIQFVAGIVVVVAGTLLQISRIEWAIVLGWTALVLSLEAINTAIEHAVDLASPQLHPVAKRAKDMAAGAVLIAVTGAVASGLLIFVPRVLTLFNGS